MRGLINMAKARIYVTTECLYASGNHFGEWLELNNYSNKKEFEIAFRALSQTEEEPKMMILLWQDIPKVLVSTKDISAKVFRLIKAVLAFDKHKNSAFHLWLDRKSPEIFTYKSREILSFFDKAYQGYFPQDEAFGRYYAKEFLAITDPEFDYISFAGQLFDKQFIRLKDYVFRQ